MPLNPSADIVFADGPLAAPYQPQKPAIRRIFKQVEQAIDAFSAGAGSIAKATMAQLYADLAHAPDVTAWVYNDPTVGNNGIYRKSGSSGAGSWTRILDLPFSFIVASNPGAGTPNAIQATTSMPVSSSALVILPVAATNTASPVTVKFNSGSALTVKTNSGNDVSAGGLVAGMLLLGIVSGSTFRLVSDQISGAIVAAAEAAADRAEAAALSVVSYIQSPLKVSFYCQGDGTNEDTKFSQFFAELGDRGVDGVVDIPVRLASSKTLTGYMATLRSAGEGRLTFSGGTDGLIFDNSTILSGYGHPLCLENVDILTETDGLGTAVQFTGSDYLNTTLIRSVEWDRVRAYGVDDTKGWKKFAQFRRTVNGVLYAPAAQGRSNLGAPGFMEVGMEFLDGCNGIDIRTPTISWGGTAIKVSDQGLMTEAIRVYGGYVQACQIGFLSTAPGAHHVSEGVH